MLDDYDTHDPQLVNVIDMCATILRPMYKDYTMMNVEKYHRTVEDYFTGLQRAGFLVEQLRELSPQRQYFPDEQTYWRRKRIPLFLFMAERKPR